MAYGASPSLGLTMPTFWVGTMLVIVLSIFFDWIPPLIYRNFWEDPQGQFHPVGVSCGGSRLLRQCSHRTYDQGPDAGDNALRFTSAPPGQRDCTSGLVIMRHALRNALLPVTTVAGLQFGALLGGTVITETIFACPPRPVCSCPRVFERDYPVLQTITLLFAGIFLVLNLMVGLAVRVAGPPDSLSIIEAHYAFPRTYRHTSSAAFRHRTPVESVRSVSCAPSP